MSCLKRERYYCTVMLVIRRTFYVCAQHATVTEDDPILTLIPLGFPD